MNIKDCTKYVIEGVEYVTIEDFCQLTARSRTAINLLIREGNKQRKLRVLRPSRNKSYIPVNEYYEYPFSEGNKRNNVYNYQEDGSIKLNEELNEENRRFDNVIKNRIA